MNCPIILESHMSLRQCADIYMWLLHRICEYMWLLMIVYVKFFARDSSFNNNLLIVFIV